MSQQALEVLGGQRTWAVEQGDCLAWLESLPADSVDLVFGSPPYELARLYLENGEDPGAARPTEEWVAWMVRVVQASLRVCRGLVAFVVEGQTNDYRYSAGPLLLMADLHRAGVCLRKPPAYRRVGIAGSGGPDWLRNDYEFIVCCTRGGRLPWSDNTAMGHPPRWGPGGAMSHRLTDGQRVNQWGATGAKSGGRVRRQDGTRPQPNTPDGKFVKMGSANGYKDGDTRMDGVYLPPAIANPGNVVQETYTAEEVAAFLGQPQNMIDCKVGGGQMGNRLCHENEAPFPERLPEFFVRSFCPPHGVCCDPFSGSGTTLAVAVRWGRRFVGCDLRQSQVDLARRRLDGETPMTLFAEED